jgi:hypothetical protein
VAQVTSIARERGCTIGIVAVLTASVALVSAPAAFGAGDPIAGGNFKFKRAGAFKNQLQRNGVRLRPKRFRIRTGSSLDPTTGAGTIRIGKVKFRKGGKKVVYSNVKVNLGANGAKGGIRSSQGKIFKISGGTLTRQGFGVALNGVKAKFTARAAKRINRKLDLGSLHRGRAGTVFLDEQPKTVQVLGGTAFVDIPTGYLPPSGFVPGSGQDPNTVPAKQPSHCISPVNGVEAIAPAELGSTLHPNPNVPLPAGVSARFKFPVTGGTVAPAGNDGVIQLAGGARLQSGRGFLPSPPFAPGTPDTVVFPQGANCALETPGATTSRSVLDTTNLAPNLGLLNVQSNVFIGGTNPGCWSAAGAAQNPPSCGVFPGDKGIAIGQVLDASGETVASDPSARTVSVTGAVVKNNPVSTATLGGAGCSGINNGSAGLFPNGTSPCDPTKDFADGDKFGISSISVNTR